jgi:polysaccharide export outer membrane protein
MTASLVRLSFVAVLFIALVTAAQGQEARRTVRLRPGDAVFVEVRDEPTLVGAYRLDDAGRVLLPLVGLIQVGGREFDDVRREIETAYAGELHDRDLRVTPLMRVSVLGEVRQPGLYDIDPTMTLSDLVARAGGFGPEANRDHIEVVRGGAVVAVVAQTGLAAFSQPLVSGDQIVFGRLSWAQRNSGALIGSAGSLVVAIVTGLILR